MKMRPASERIAEARAALAAAEQEIAELEQRRRAALLADADGAAAVADDELVAARARAKRLTDKITLLEPLVAEEQCEGQLPNDLRGSRRLLAQLELRQRALATRPRLDRSAADDGELDDLATKIPFLKQRIELLGRMS